MMAEFPLDPQLAKMMVAAPEYRWPAPQGSPFRQRLSRARQPSLSPVTGLDRGRLAVHGAT